MNDFLNDALSKFNIKNNYLYPIYVDNSIILNHYLKFSGELLRNIEDFYLSKNNYCLGTTTPYRYFIRMKDREKPPIICNEDYDDFLFYIEFSNLDTERSILIGISKTTSHLHFHFYRDYIYGKTNENAKIVGGLFLVSNMFNNGISVSLLNVLYNFMEKNEFDHENLFQPINYI